MMMIKLNTFYGTVEPEETTALTRSIRSARTSFLCYDVSPAFVARRARNASSAAAQAARARPPSQLARKALSTSSYATRKLRAALLASSRWQREVYSVACAHPPPALHHFGCFACGLVWSSLPHAQAELPVDRVLSGWQPLKPGYSST
eukprot:6186865-Pleurochrysis_carterae.AAC.1